MVEDKNILHKEKDNSPSKRRAMKWFIIFAISYYIIDFIYKTVNNINYMNKDKCILSRMLPKWGFLFFEYFVELTIIVTIGIFLAVLLDKWFSKYKKFYPKTPMSAFIYGSLAPVCACTVIPLIRSMKERLGIKTIVTFVVAAPLLSPYIMMLSFSVLGIKYSILRIISSFILAISSGFVVDFFHTKDAKMGPIKMGTCNSNRCPLEKKDIYLETYGVLKMILPFLIIAGVMGIVFELAMPYRFLMNSSFGDGIMATVLAILIGIPIYFCNGAEVLFLRPLIHSAGISLGTAMAFSLASTSICVTSMIMLFKFLGKKLTLVLLANIIVVTLLLSYIIDLFF